MQQQQQQQQHKQAYKGSVKYLWSTDQIRTLKNFIDF